MKSNVFADFAAFEEYVHSVFCSETAEIYLYGNSSGRSSRYLNIDGQLYLDINACGAKGYYVDWS